MFEDFSSWKIQVLMARALLRKHVWTDPCSVGTQWPGRHTTERSKALGYKLTAHCCSPHFGWMTQEWLVIKLSFHINTWQSAFVHNCRISELNCQVWGLKLHTNARAFADLPCESPKDGGGMHLYILGCSSHLSSNHRSSHTCYPEKNGRISGGHHQHPKNHQVIGVHIQVQVGVQGWKQPDFRMSLGISVEFWCLHPHNAMLVGQTWWVRPKNG